MLKSKAAKRAADIIAIHPYSGAVRDIKKQFRLTREMLDRARLVEAPIWVTEIGWGTGSGDSESIDRLPRAASDTTCAAPSGWRSGCDNASAIGRVVWYQWRDGTDDICKWCGTSGLLRRTASRSRSSNVFSGIARL